VVLAVLSSELTIAEAARRHGTTGKTVAEWRGIARSRQPTADLTYPHAPEPSRSMGLWHMEDT
jgi:transposase-like protein